MAIASITGFRKTLDSFVVEDEQGNTVYLDFCEVERWYKRAKVRRESDEKKFEAECKASRDNNSLCALCEEDPCQCDTVYTFAQ